MRRAYLPAWTVSLAMLLMVVVGSAHAAINIAIDGSDADWTAQSIGFDNQDAIGDNYPAVALPSWDIDKNFHAFAPVSWTKGPVVPTGGNSGTTSYYDFMVQMVGPFVAPVGNNNDRLQIILNTDMNSGTGTTLRGWAGADYYLGIVPSLLADGPAGNYATLYKWTGSWTAVDSNVVVARSSTTADYWVVEAGINPDDIWGAGGTPQNIQWGAFLTPNYNTSPTTFAYPYDHCMGVDSSTGVTGQGWKLVEVGNNIPEPGTTALFGMGLLGLAAIRRRRAQA
jgi:hypothetical protein